MPRRFEPGELITADIINNILERLERLEALADKAPKNQQKEK